VLFVHDPRDAQQQLQADPSATVLLLGSDAELLEFGVRPGDAALLARSGAHRLIRLPRTTLEQLEAQP
jgi:hypothetical protein